MKVLSVLALVLFVSTHAFANSSKPEAKPAEQAAAAPAEQKNAEQPAPQAGEVQAKKPKKAKKH